MSTIEFTPQKLKDLKEIYNEAVLRGIDHFCFEDNMLLTSYAKYLIEYLETKIGG